MRRSIPLACALYAALASPAARAQTDEAAQALEAQRQEIEAQRRELAELRRQLADRRVEQRRLGEAVEQLARIQRLIDDAEAASRAREQGQLEAQANASRAADLLRDADVALLQGDGGIDDSLAQAEGLLLGTPRAYVTRARGALADSDLSGARMSIEAALRLLE